jgi:outer membrane protein assembly factor BamD (BamD/ComL family)
MCLPRIRHALSRIHFGFLILVSLSILSFIPWSEARPDEGILVTEHLQLRIADTLMEEGEFYRAITEYKRFAILFPESASLDYALFKTGVAYYKGEEYEAAARSFFVLEGKYKDSVHSSEASFLRGLALWRLNRLTDAASAFERVAAEYFQSEYVPVALVARALLALDVDDVDQAMSSLQRLIDEYPDHPRAEMAMEAFQLLPEYRDLPQKSKALAAVMSAILPGSGYIYAGNYGDGLTAFFLNGLFIAGAAVGISEANYALGGLVGVIGLPFYFGNIYGSANAVKKANLAVKDSFKKRIYRVLDFDIASYPMP